MLARSPPPLAATRGIVDGVLRYFAYGSNLDSARLLTRVPSARAEAVAVLSGYRWQCNKRGRDGSAKANIEPDGVSQVWGVVYQMDNEGWSQLDPFEGGYRRIQVVVHSEVTPLAVETYLATDTMRDQRPSAAYRGWLLSGAREHALPDACLERIAALVVKPDLEGR